MQLGGPLIDLPSGLVGRCGIVPGGASPAGIVDDLGVAIVRVQFGLTGFLKRLAASLPGEEPGASADDNVENTPKEEGAPVVCIRAMYGTSLWCNLPSHVINHVGRGDGEDKVP